MLNVNISHNVKPPSKYYYLDASFKISYCNLPDGSFWERRLHFLVYSVFCLSVVNTAVWYHVFLLVCFRLTTAVAWREKQLLMTWSKQFRSWHGYTNMHGSWCTYILLGQSSLMPVQSCIALASLCCCISYPVLFVWPWLTDFLIHLKTAGMKCFVIKMFGILKIVTYCGQEIVRLVIDSQSSISPSHHHVRSVINDLLCRMHYGNSGMNNGLVFS